MFLLFAAIPDEHIRHYHITDNEMLQDSNTVKLLFHDDKLVFVNFDTNLFSDPFEDNYGDSITDAENTITDEAYQDQLQTKTEEVELKMQDCREKYNEVKFYVQKTFPDSPGKQSEFGLDDYNEIRASQTGMRRFMTTMHAAAERYKVELIARGYTQLKIDAIETLGNALETSDSTQEVHKKRRITTTEERVDLHNRVWDDFRVPISKASKIIFANDFAKRQQYLLPPGEAAEEDLSISGTVTDEVSVPLNNVNVKVVELSLILSTNSLGKYAVAAIADGNYTLEFTHPDYVPQSVPVTVVAGVVQVVDIKLVHV